MLVEGTSSENDKNVVFIKEIQKLRINYRCKGIDVFFKLFGGVFHTFI
jgi:hypothetical protein